MDRHDAPKSLVKRRVAGLLETREATAAGRLTVAETVSACRLRIVAANAELAAFTVINDVAPEAAPDLPLAGISIGVKDLYDTAGMTTTYGSAVYREHVPTADAALVARLRELGGYVAGKTVTTEFAWRQAGPTVNPWNAGHTPGGSSSGSAAAVAAGLVPLAIGTQTFGSIIRPAAFCGIVGFKPGYGVLPLQGVHPLSPTLDHAGLLARSVGDVAYVFGLLTAGKAEVSSRPPRLLLVRGKYWTQANERQQAVLDEAAAEYARQGAIVEARELPGHFDSGLDVAEVLLCHEAAAIYGPLILAQPQLVSDHIKDLVARGQAITAEEYRNALATRDRLRTAYADVIDGYDAVLTLPALGEAPLLREGTGNPAPCVLWTLLGVPALTLSRAIGADNLPLGIQLVGRDGADTALLAAGRWCEQGRD